MTLVALSCGVQVALGAVNGVNAMVEAMFTTYDSLPCVRSISKHGAVGCGSPNDDDVARGGALFLVESLSDLQGLVDNQHGLEEIAIVMDDAIFDGESMRVIEEISTKIFISSVIITVDSEGSPQVPAQSSAPPSSWAPTGDGLLNETVSFVVTRMRNASQSEEVRALAETNRNNGYADAVYLHSARYQFYLGKKDATSTSCLPGGHCDPLGGLSVWGTVGSTLLNSSKETVMITTNLDSSDIFHDVVPARDAAASGVAAVLLSAQALAAVDSSILASLPSQIAVALFNGEFWDRVGSRRFVRDIASGSCSTFETSNPYNGSTCAEPLIYALAWTELGLNNISDVVSVSNVVGSPSTGEYYYHAASGSPSSEATASLLNILENSTDLNITLTSSGETGVLPPSPLDSFLEATNETSQSYQGSGFVFAGFKSAITDVNPRYLSRYDRRLSGTNADLNETQTAARIAQVATLIARYAFVQAGGTVGDAVENVNVNTTLASDLWGCLTDKFACELVANVLGASSVDAVASYVESSALAATSAVSDGPPSFFSGIYSAYQVENSNIKPLPLFVRDYLAQYGRDNQIETNITSEYACSADLACMELSSPPTCALGRSALACIRGVCVCSNAYFHDALSTSVNISDGSYEILNADSDVDAIWTEPRWTDGSLTLYYVATSSSTMIALLVVGFGMSATCIFALRYLIICFRDTKFKLD